MFETPNCTNTSLVLAIGQVPDHLVFVYKILKKAGILEYWKNFKSILIQFNSIYYSAVHVYFSIWFHCNNQILKSPIGKYDGLPKEM